MASIIPGYEYDIFISYRQKDNKYDGWVTEFVDNLKKELEATFKEEISVYFDINPHDGLLETHDVDESLKEKLKCLVFIPILSRTYCDPKSFAWEHEFMAFVEKVSNDQFGLKIKLPNGNVAGRVLPVQIYDLEKADIRLCESVLEGVIRGVEFIYKEPGVNRPLRATEENPHDNLNHTTYRNQINKVANAIKEIITAMVQHGEMTEKFSEPVLTQRRSTDKNKRKLIISASTIALAVVISVLLFVPKLFKLAVPEEKSIAVLPFKLLSDEPDKQYLADGMMDAITLHLSKISDLRVMSTTSVEQYRGTAKTARVIGKELDVKYLLEGSFQKFGEDTKLIVQLIRASEESHVWADEYNSRWSDVFSLQSEVARKIASELMVALTPEEAGMMEERPTGNLEAYQAYLRGRYYASQPHFTYRNWNLAMQNFQEAAGIDTTFALAYGELAHAHARMIYLRQDMSESRYEMAAQAAEKAMRLGAGQAGVHLALGYYYLYAYRDTEKALMHLEKAEKGLPGNVDIMIEKAEIIVTLGRWEEFIRLLEKAEKLSPNDAGIPSELALGYWYTRRYNKAIDACNRAIAISPNSKWPYLYKIFTYWSWKGPCKESREALEFINKEHEWYLFTLCWQAVYEGNFTEVFQVMSDTSRIWNTHTKMWAVPRTMFLAVIYDHLNEPEMAREGYKTAAAVLEKKISEVPADPRYHSALGIVYAGLGRKEEAISEGLKAVELLPVSKDAVYSIPHLQDLAMIYTKTGEYDLAFERLEQLLSIPSWLSPTWVEWDFRFAPLKALPEYKKLMKKYAVEE
jgi:serine/threonine-protein kinase